MTENKYHNGKIYKIVSTGTDKVYYGSTTNKLWSRFSQHKGNFRLLQNGKKSKYTSAFKLFERYGIESCRIILVENFKCENRDELLAREQYYIDSDKNGCVNRSNAHGIDAEKAKRTQAKYYADNKDRLNKQKLEQYHLKKDDPKYMEQRHKINAKWRANNAEYDKARKHEWGKQLYHCDVCNVDVKRYSKSAHEKTEKHKNNLS